MSTTPTLRDAAQAAYELLSSGMGIPDEKYRVVTELAAALTQGAGEAVEPVAPAAWWIEKAEQFALPSKDGTRPFDRNWQPLYTAQQLQQAVARASQFEGQRDQLQKEFFAQAAQIGLMEAEIASLRAALGHERNTGGRDE